MASNDPVRVITWNVLADCYSRGQIRHQQPKEDSSTAATPDPLSWSYRRELISHCLETIQADIYCLQEVDHYHDFYSPFFRSHHHHSYESIYLQRPAGKKDGCLIAFSSTKFHLEDKEEIDLDRLSCLDVEERFVSRSKFAKQNVALFLLLTTTTMKKCEEGEEKGIKEEKQQKKRKVIIATCHLHWNPNLPEVKFAQAQLILEELTRFRARHSLSSSSGEDPIPVILTGDFNSMPHDELYPLITGQINLTKGQHLLLFENTLSLSQQRNSLGLRYLYGPNTKFLCDYGLARLCRWMRVLGVDVAMDSWENNGKAEKEEQTSTGSTKMAPEEKKNGISQFFNRARSEKRVILTTSKSLLERTTCPQSFYVNPNKLEESLVRIYEEYGLDLNRERFLTVCGKCGGEIEEVEASDERFVGKSLPLDRQLYACKYCAQVRIKK